MTTHDEHREQESWRRLEEIAQEPSAEALEEFLGSVSSSEVSVALARLSEDDRARILSILPPGRAASLVEQIPEVQAVEFLERLDPRAAAAILDRLPSDEQADLLGDLERGEAESILREMAPEEARQARALTLYEPDVAGGLMMKEYLSYPESYTVSDVVDDLRSNAERYRDYDVQYAYVVDPLDVLVGVLRLRDLLFTRKDATIRELMVRKPVSITDTEPLEELRGFFDRHHFFGAPVVDGSGRLVGIIRRAAVEEALADRSESDYLKTQGIVGGEELRSMPVLLRSGRRLSWLSINIVLNVLAASVIAFYQETLAAVIALAVFLPIISDMSGCSGSQAVAVSVRELTLGLVRPVETVHVWLKEVSVGAINGLALGILIAVVAWLWKGNVYLGLVVGLAMSLNTVVAVSIGGTVPLVLRRFNMDPALASGPILTTITDMCGFFLILSIASALLPRLTM